MHGLNTPHPPKVPVSFRNLQLQHCNNTTTNGACCSECIVNRSLKASYCKSCFIYGRHLPCFLGFSQRLQFQKKKTKSACELLAAFARFWKAAPAKASSKSSLSSASPTDKPSSCSTSPRGLWCLLKALLAAAKASSGSSLSPLSNHTLRELASSEDLSNSSLLCDMGPACTCSSSEPRMSPPIGSQSVRRIGPTWNKSRLRFTRDAPTYP